MKKRLFTVLLCLSGAAGLLTTRAQSPDVVWRREFRDNNTIKSDDGNIIRYSTHNGNIIVEKINSVDGSVEWASEEFGGNGEDVCNRLINSNDGGVVFVGRSASSDISGNSHQGGNDGWIVKLNSDGILQWQKTIGGKGNDNLRFIHQNSDNSYMISGATSSEDGDLALQPSKGGNDRWLIKLNEDGSVNWQKTYGGSKSDIVSIMQVNSANNIILSGNSASEDGDLASLPAKGGNDVWIMEVSHVNGDILWSKKYGGSKADVFSSVIEDGVNGGYICAGYTLSDDLDILFGGSTKKGGQDYWVVKLASDGDMQWQKCYGGTGADQGTFEQAYSVDISQEGQYVVAGIAASSDEDVSAPRGGNSSDIWILWLGTDGEIIRDKSYGGTMLERYSGIMPLSDGSWLVSGKTASIDGDIHDGDPEGGAAAHPNIPERPWIFQIDKEGEIQWSKYIYAKGDPLSVTLTANAIQTPDGGYVFASDYWITKLRPCPELVSQSASVCENEAYEFNGTILTAAGEYKDTLLTAGGCDSIITLTLHHLPAYTVVQDASICSGETFEFYDQSLTASGSYYHVLKSVAGCDSTIFLRFVVNALPQPVLTSDNNVLTAGSYAEYGWYYNNAPLEEDGHSLEAVQTGFYRVAVTDAQGCRGISDWYFVGVPVLDAFDLEGRYVWKFSIPGMGDQVSAQEYYADRIDYRMTGNAYANDYSMTMESYDGEEGRWIGVGSGGSSIDKDGLYYVLFFREYRGDSVLVYKHECVSREEAYTFVYPAEDAVSDYGWNWYVRDAGTGMYSLSGGHLAELYPNPVESKVEVRHSYSGAVSFRLLDTYGRLVGSSSNGASIDMSGCSSGVYLLQIYEDNILRYTGRVVKR